MLVTIENQKFSQFRELFGNYIVFVHNIARSWMKVLRRGFCTALKNGPLAGQVDSVLQLYIDYSMLMHSL